MLLMVYILHLQEYEYEYEYILGKKSNNTLQFKSHLLSSLLHKIQKSKYNNNICESKKHIIIIYIIYVKKYININIYNLNLKIVNSFFMKKICILI